MTTTLPTYLGLFRQMSNETKNNVRAASRVLRIPIRQIMHDALTEALTYLRRRELAHRRRGASKRRALRLAARDFEQLKKFPRATRKGVVRTARK